MNVLEFMEYTDTYFSIAQPFRGPDESSRVATGLLFIERVAISKSKFIKAITYNLYETSSQILVREKELNCNFNY